MTTASQEHAEPRPRTGLYLYSFADAGLSMPADLRGLNDEPVSIITRDAVSAVVGPIAAGRLRPERRHLAAHQAVLAKLMSVTTVLPVGFGMVVPNASRLKRIMAEEMDVLSEQLEQVRECVEMAVRVSWDVPNIFQYLVEQEPVLKAARDRMLAQDGNHQAKVAAGELFGKIVASRRQTHERQVVELLESVADQIIVDPLKAEHEIVRLSFLVARPQLDAFETALAQAAAGFDASFRFDYSGPWAPHSFTQLRISPDQTAEVA